MIEVATNCFGRQHTLNVPGNKQLSVIYFQYDACVELFLFLIIGSGIFKEKFVRILLNVSDCYRGLKELDLLTFSLFAAAHRKLKEHAKLSVFLVCQRLCEFRM